MQPHYAMHLAERLRRVALAVAIVLLSACSAPRQELVPIPYPDAGALEPSVGRALTLARTQFEQAVAAKPADDALARAYGDLAMSYHAHDLVPAAEAAYRNARALAPREKRWAYLYGHVENDSGNSANAVEGFEAALAIDPNDPAILFSLGQVYLQRGEPDKAQPLFEKLRATEAARAAALAGLGKAALAKRQYREAVGYFEEALKLSPASTRLWQPLAVAYRGLGDRAKAEDSLRRYHADGLEPEIVDPIVDSLWTKVAASRPLLRRGQRLSRVGQFDEAARTFRAALEADPQNADAAANLGATLANLGRLDEAQRELDAALALDDRIVFAHLSLGVVRDRLGQDPGAAEQYRATLARDPANVQAAIYLADLEMRAGRADEAAKRYKDVLVRSPNLSGIELALALAYVKSGRYDEARAVLEAALVKQPNNAEVGNALARILATAPQRSTRDGPRAVSMARGLFETARHPEIGQTYAMALAETGQFDQAASLQREVIVVTERMGDRRKMPFLERNLALYRERKPAREAWASDDPLFMPRRPAVQLARKS